MRKGYKRKFVKKSLAVFIIIFSLLLQVACGQKELPYQMGGSGQSGSVQTEQSGVAGTEVTGDGAKEIQILEKTSGDVYQAKDMGAVEKWGTLMEGFVTEEGVYYKWSKEIRCHSYTGGQVDKQALIWEDDSERWSVSNFCLDQDGNVYTYTFYGDEGYFLCKFDSEGIFQYKTSLKDFTEKNGEAWVSNWELTADTKGCVYLATDTTIRLHDAEGSYYGDVAFDSADVIITDLEATSDGTVYLLYTRGMTTNSYLAKLDFAGKKIENIGKTIELAGVAEGKEGYLYLYSRECLYEYDTQSGEMVPLFAWNDCNINGQEVLELSVTVDDRLAVMNGTISDYDGQVTLIKRMTKEEAAAVPEKQEIVIGMLGSPEKALSEAVVRFNKESDLYRIVMRNYLSDTDFDTAKMKLNGEIISGEGPDIFEVSNVDMDNLAEKGLFADLYECLEKSDVLSKEDFFERLLELYTRDGKLVAMPQAFSVSTYMGNKALLGDRKSWTLEEMLAFVEANPGKDVTYYTGKLNMLNLCMRFNEAEFIDWETGECRFTSEKFIHLLKLCNSYPETGMGWKGGSSMLTTAVNGDVLLVDVTVGRLDNLQPYSRIFEAGYTYMGFPTSEGMGYECLPESVMAISALSEKQEGAWAFLEYFYQYRRTFSSAFPALKSIFEAESAAEINKDSRLMGKMSFPDGASYEIQLPTWEDVDVVYELIDGMQMTGMDIDVFFIIKEEAAAYFEGQKTVDEVAKIIQNRVQIYVDENR